MRHSGWVRAAALLTATVAGVACMNGSSLERERVSLEGRGAFTSGDAVVSVEVPSCNGEPEVESLQESADQVHIVVVTTTGSMDDCLDSVEIELSEPLGDRELVDDVSGAIIAVEVVPGPQASGSWSSQVREDAQVPAWFATEGFPDAVEWWFAIGTTAPETPEAALELSIELLDEPPPEGWQSAFRGGIEILSVSLEGTQVVIDLATASPGLHGHGSHGLILGTQQLQAAASYFFPDATTLCVAYDGVPTDIENGGPIFLHDATGCPIPLGVAPH